MHFSSLHDNTDLVEEACALLETCWPKSRFARTRKLCSEPRPHLPVSIVMVDRGAVIGHYRLSECLENAKWCVVESVIISPTYRGLGYGSALMNHCIGMAASLHMEELYLSTKDKMTFYAKLGFLSSATPVSILSKVNWIFRGKHCSVAASSTPGVEWMSKDLLVQA